MDMAITACKSFCYDSKFQFSIENHHKNKRQMNYNNYMKNRLNLYAILFLSMFSANAQGISEEMIYLQTDKGIYETGEDLWFKTYTLDKSSLSLLGNSKTLYLEMLNENDSIVWQEKYPIQSGITNGHLYVDKNLSEGDYRIHAYTQYSFLPEENTHCQKHSQ